MIQDLMKLVAPSSPLDEEDTLEEWENDEDLLPHECVSISHKGSVYKRERAYNMIHKKKVTANLRDLVKHIVM